MKRIILTAVLVFSAMMSFAGNPLKIISGKYQVQTIMKESATVVVVYDWSQAQYDNKKALKKEWGDNYDLIVEDCEKSFIEGFNDNAKKLRIDQTSENARYRFVLTIKNVDRFFAAMAFIPAHEAKMWGTLTILDNMTNQTLAEIDIDEAEDGQHVDIRYCYGETFEELGEKVAKLK